MPPEDEINLQAIIADLHVERERILNELRTATRKVYELENKLTEYMQRAHEAEEMLDAIKETLAGNNPYAY